MKETITKTKFFTIADFAEEEVWLRKQHNSGWRLVKMSPPCFYQFESCEPEDVIYRLDFTNNAENADYMQMMDDYGWEYFGRCVGWLYFRKSASEVCEESDGELFSDNASRVEMLRKVIFRRMLPIAVIFLCCVVPGAMRSFEDFAFAPFALLWAVLFVLYTYIILHCGLKLIRLKKELE